MAAGKFICVRVAPRECERKAGGKLPQRLFLKEQEYGPGFMAQFSHKKDKEAYKRALGREGVMTKEDWDAKNFTPYNLQKYMTESDPQKLVSLENANSELQSDLMKAQAEKAKLEAKLKELESKESKKTPEKTTEDKK